MHIAEGVLPPVILASSAALTAAGVCIGLKKLNYDRIMTTAILSAAFFVASLIHIPIGPVSGHLILNGLLGLMLGWVAFPAILVALTLQAILFQFGGLTTLGVNTLNMALSPVICFYVFRPMLSRGTFSLRMAAFLCGMSAVALSAVLTSGTLALGGDNFLNSAKILLLSSVPVMIIEGLITAIVVGFLAKVAPQIFDFKIAVPNPGIATQTSPSVTE
ncbi:cobalt transporter CbiM [Halodesulfovibrio marinisediminis]|uniref:Cobalt/nickel transport system permease protein n=1 Tax=Halodesulfovibrio marinisediminis DSM 17456 TaxID=1121457 RepID=A0A1N6IBS4_9BACT|nr:cobalt transporter CbiM [Halodesulfovibrio marinisediminis]SIO29498.1 cobalt/nickel transport system permease protein [Halodesulfovibrio marinisediminis DSM 17456]